MDFLAEALEKRVAQARERVSAPHPSDSEWTVRLLGYLADEAQAAVEHYAKGETRTIFAVTYGTCPMRQATYDSIEGARAYIDRAAEVRGEEYRAQYGIVTSTITTIATPWKDAR